MKRFAIFTLALSALLLCGTVQASHVSVAVGGYGHNSFATFRSYSYSFAPPVVATVAYPVQLGLAATYAAPAVGACQTMQALPTQSFAAPADPCAAVAGTYGVAPVGLAQGYQQSFGLVQGYGRTAVYQNNGAFFGFNRHTNAFVRFPAGRVRASAFRGVSVGNGVAVSGVAVRARPGIRRGNVNVAVGAGAVGGPVNVNVRQRTGLLGLRRGNVNVQVR